MLPHSATPAAMNHLRRLSRHFLLAILVLAPALQAQEPNTLLHSIPPLHVGVQGHAQLGSSVAVEGDYAVAGAPNDDTGGTDSGVVKVFHSGTGALLFVLPNPSPAMDDNFGFSVAISGTRIVVGAWQDDTGASNAGSAYVYDLTSATPTIPVATLNNPSPAASDDFGYSVAISGTRILVGAPYEDTGAPEAGSAYVYDLSSATPTVPTGTLNKPSPAKYDRFGYCVAISGTRLVVGAFGDDTGATNAGSAYVYDLRSATPTVPKATLNNPSPAATDYFGYCVAISGTRVVVGAFGDDTGGTDAGSAYVYDLTSGTPTVPSATLYAPSPAKYENFGSSVAISGTRVVVGAPQDDTGAEDTGRVYVYDLTGTSPRFPVATLNHPSPAAGDKFGWSVALSGSHVVVGAPYDDTAAEDAGSAYAYNLTSATPAFPTATLNHPGPAASDYFGHSVAISGARVVVGAFFDDVGATNAGSAYIYDLSSATPRVPVITLHNPSPAENDFFGCSVAISGTRIVVGACRDDTGATDAGSAYVYDLTSATPTVPVATLNKPSPEENDYFGNSVAISGTRVVVSAPNDDKGATDAGSAYVYDLTSATPTVPTVTLKKPSAKANDYFGFSVAISDTRVVVGAPNDDTGATDAGSAYVYDLTSATPSIPTITLNNPSPAQGDDFGASVAISGTRVVVGANGDDTGVINAGSAYVYDLTSATPTIPTATLNSPSPAEEDCFGNSVAMSGTRVVVGAYQDDTGARDAGSAYVYDLTSATPTVPVATLNKSSPAADDQFGFSVALSGSTIVIGTPNDDTVMLDKGYAYIYGPKPAAQQALPRKPAH